MDSYHLLSSSGQHRICGSQFTSETCVAGSPEQVFSSFIIANGFGNHIRGSLSFCQFNSTTIQFSHDHTFSVSNQGSGRNFMVKAGMTFKCGRHGHNDMIIFQQLFAYVHEAWPSEMCTRETLRKAALEVHPAFVPVSDPQLPQHLLSEPAQL